MIYHFLAHLIDIKRSNLIDKLAATDIISPYEKQKIKEQKKADAKVNSLLLMLSEKSAAQFESFLTTLSETGQPSVADILRPARQTVSKTGHNPLHYPYGMPSYYNFYRAMLRRARLCHSMSSVRPSVCLSVVSTRLSICDVQVP